MKTTRIAERSAASRLLVVAALAGSSFLAGCAGDSAIMGSSVGSDSWTPQG